MTRVAIIVFPGSNCDADTLAAARVAGSDAYYVWHRERDLRRADVAILPGGFSYGDYLRAGAIARFSPAMQAVADHARAGGAVLGICNGFQILCEAGLLPGALTRNAGLRFLSRPVRIRVDTTQMVSYSTEIRKGFVSVLLHQRKLVQGVVVAGASTLVRLAASPLIAVGVDFKFVDGADELEVPPELLKAMV